MKLLWPTTVRGPNCMGPVSRLSELRYFAASHLPSHLVSPLLIKRLASPLLIR